MPNRSGPLAEAKVLAALGATLLLAACLGADGQEAIPTTTPADYVAPATVDTAGLPGPVQPIFYRHDVHAGQYKMDCRYCHFAAEVSPHPGIPSIYPTCMGCHSIVGGDNPEVEKLREAAMNEQPVEWVKVHQLPPFVHFPHMRHVKAAGITCQTCHGPVQEMARVYQFASLRMGWCLDCHKKNEQTTDCTACHY
jgi:hypothetical protein